MGSTLRIPGIVHGCYRDSRTGSAVATVGMLAHWRAGTWHRAVDRFIALSAFAKKKLIEGGLPESKILVKQNFVDPDPGARSGSSGNYLFVGRLTEEKGVRTLIQCWKSGTDLPLLTFVGRGPLEDEVRDAAAAMKNVEWLGSRNSDEVSELMGSAKALLCPSLWYEAMPRVVIESMAVGTPVIASRLGSYPEMIADGESGVLFECGNANDLLHRLQNLEATGALIGMRSGARLRYESEYTGSRNLVLLLKIYEQVLSTVATASQVPVSVA
jgi:glycosyltransferase involved in cell wall biosynthesis